MASPLVLQDQGRAHDDPKIVAVVEAIKAEMKPGGNPIEAYMELNGVCLPPSLSLHLTNRIFGNVFERLIEIEKKVWLAT
jgi:hypothetical protein